MPRKHEVKYKFNTLKWITVTVSFRIYVTQFFEFYNIFQFEEVLGWGNVKKMSEQYFITSRLFRAFNPSNKVTLKIILSI